MVNIIRGLLLGILLFFVARNYGIIGTLIATLTVVLITDFSYFTYRLYKLGYLHASLIKSTLNLWAVVIPVGAILVWGCKMLVQGMFIENMHITKLFVSAGIFSSAFLILLLAADSEVRDVAKLIKDKFILTPYYRLRKV